MNVASISLKIVSDSIDPWKSVEHFCHQMIVWKIFFLNGKRIYLFGGYCSTAQETTNGGAGNLKERPIDIFSLNTRKFIYVTILTVQNNRRFILDPYCCDQIDVACLFGE